MSGSDCLLCWATSPTDAATWPWSLLAAGWVCGWFWELWNYWAAAKWHYIFPMFQQWKIFEMLAPGYLGFLPFAWECFVMYISAKAVSGALRARSRQKLPVRQQPEQ